jgi:hypothetical protein
MRGESTTITKELTKTIDNDSAIDLELKGIGKGEGFRNNQAHPEEVGMTNDPINDLPR